MTDIYSTFNRNDKGGVGIKTINKRLSFCKKASVVSTVTLCIAIALFVWMIKYDILVENNNTLAGVIGIALIVIRLTCFLFIVVCLPMYLKFTKVQKEMISFESKHSDFSRLYYRSDNSSSGHSIYDIVTHIDNEPAVRGFNENGEFIYLVDKEISDNGFIMIPTYVRVSPTFFKKSYGIKGKSLAALRDSLSDMDFIFMYPKSNNLIVLGADFGRFGMHHNWNGKNDVMD